MQSESVVTNAEPMLDGETLAIFIVLLGLGWGTYHIRTVYEWARNRGDSRAK